MEGSSKVISTAWVQYYLAADGMEGGRRLKGEGGSGRRGGGRPGSVLQSMP